MSTETQALGLSLAVERLREALSVIAEQNGWQTWELALASDGSVALDFGNADEGGNYSMDPEPDPSDWEDLIELTNVNL